MVSLYRSKCHKLVKFSHINHRSPVFRVTVYSVHSGNLTLVCLQKLKVYTQDTSEQNQGHCYKWLENISVAGDKQPQRLSVAHIIFDILHGRRLLGCMGLWSGQAKCDSSLHIIWQLSGEFISEGEHSYFVSFISDPLNSGINKWPCYQCWEGSYCVGCWGQCEPQFHLISYVPQVSWCLTSYQCWYV